MAVSIPFTSTVTNHGLLIQAGGQAVGAITSWSTNQTRTGTPVFEFGSITVGGGDDVTADPGEPYEIVPGNIGGTEIRIRRYDVYTLRFENAFRTNNLQMLTRQDRSIKLLEFFVAPDSALSFTNVYYGSWFTSLGRDHDAKGDRIVMANATIMYARKREVA